MMVTGLAAVLLALAFLLTLVSIIQPLAKRLEISEAVLLALTGIGLGLVASLIVRSSATDLLDGAAEALIYFPVNSEAFLLIFLPILVFQGAMAIDVRRLAHETATVLLLAVVAVIVSTATIGFALYPFAQQSLVVCLLLGSIVATTDPSAVAGIFREIGAASRLTRLVEGEALLNDAAAISIFSILLAAVTSHHQIHLADALMDFLTAFIGAIVVGVCLARLTLLLIAGLGGSAASEVTLTLALPYAVYILCDEMLGFSGVVATAAAGLTVSAYGPSTFRPQVWRFLNEMWEQLVFWAGSLVFLLAAMLVPRLLIGMTKWDFVLILIASVAGLIARSAVIFGMLPLLAITKLSPPVPNPFKATMAWGGIRGAITLALALAVTENQSVSSPVAHFVGIIATGFVLITLLVNGTTLRALVLFFKLDQLSPIDQAIRQQIVGIGLGEVAERTRELSEELGFSEQTRAGVISRLERRAEQERAANNFESALSDRNRVNIALITIANQERSLLLDLFRIQGLSRRVMETLLRTAESMADGARLEGRYGYVRALKRRLQPSLRFRIAQELHSRLHIDEPLTNCMMERFEMLIIAHLVSLSLQRFIRQRMEPTLGPRITEIVSEVLGRQRKLLDDALETLRLHYSGYSEALESRILRQIALRLEDEEYDALEADNLISEELHRELHREIERQRARLDAPLRFNLKSGIEQRLRAFPAFNGVPDSVLQKLSGKVSMHFVSPGEVLFKRGQRVRVVYAQVAGLAEVNLAERDLLFGSGDLIGAASVIRNETMPGTVRSLQFSHLLAIPRPVFEKLLKEYPIVQRLIIQRSQKRADGLLTPVTVRTLDGDAVSTASAPEMRRLVAPPS
ncbi:MAG: cation:proton antiporter [Gluconobacter potus]|uniref:Cyclic nucleotide-binding domain-containing protein n=1 Tax=Gluconobacter potus TaxID=2724927 RepID=A0ABR9YND9_9PROT|nr:MULTISPECIES: cation:proton antiporter [Gluconobacter]MBF0850504.1 cyclic nucleotide-binding domain-containing protein [Gluconobacter sp. R75690]MBF0864551.1 cyclic nucleotide-binding domain-containing protein [Gluconobacter sp. R71656]MBF0867055.1 cyclic nucleotide-binding domain-containing protein [Gluconobacter sp. R75628]MBF0873485.1 cyclic nucleotide-binding domain-containing protein [Gluconobacter sp. R75629]MBF0879196.1 cyclic nucleotide-binding domain-containing protein [Gluconobact